MFVHARASNAADMSSIITIIFDSTSSTYSCSQLESLFLEHAQIVSKHVNHACVQDPDNVNVNVVNPEFLSESELRTQLEVSHILTSTRIRTVTPAQLATILATGVRRGNCRIMMDVITPQPGSNPQYRLIPASQLATVPVLSST